MQMPKPARFSFLVFFSLHIRLLSVHYHNIKKDSLLKNDVNIEIFGVNVDSAKKAEWLNAHSAYSIMQFQPKKLILYDEILSYHDIVPKFF